MGCDCIELANKALEPEGTQLLTMFSLRGGPTCAVVASEKIPTLRQRVKPKTVIATFCPFCGKKYPDPPKHDINLVT